MLPLPIPSKSLRSSEPATTTPRPFAWAHPAHATMRLARGIRPRSHRPASDTLQHPAQTHSSCTPPSTARCTHPRHQIRLTCAQLRHAQNSSSSPRSQTLTHSYSIHSHAHADRLTATLMHTQPHTCTHSHTHAHTCTATPAPARQRPQRAQGSPSAGSCPLIGPTSCQPTGCPEAHPRIALTATHSQPQPAPQTPRADAQAEHVPRPLPAHARSAARHRFVLGPPRHSQSALAHHWSRG